MQMNMISQRRGKDMHVENKIKKVIASLEKKRLKLMEEFSEIENELHRQYELLNSTKDNLS